MNKEPNHPSYREHIAETSGIRLMEESVGGVAFNGDPLPDWREFKEFDPNKRSRSQGGLL